MGKRRLQQVRDGCKDEVESPTVQLEQAKTTEEQILDFKKQMCKDGLFQKVKAKDGSTLYCVRNSKTGKLVPVDDKKLIDIVNKK